MIDEYNLLTVYQTIPDLILERTIIINGSIIGINDLPPPTGRGAAEERSRRNLNTVSLRKLAFRSAKIC